MFKELDRSFTEEEKNALQNEADRDNQSFIAYIGHTGICREDNLEDLSMLQVGMGMTARIFRPNEKFYSI